MNIVAQVAPIVAVSPIAPAGGHAIAPTVTRSPNIPEKQLYWQGYDMYCECAITGDWLSTEEYAAMTPEEMRGYETAGRHAADTETYVYLSNTNSFGDRTEY